MSVLRKFWQFLRGRKPITRTELEALLRRLERRERMLDNKRAELLLKARQLLRQGDEDGARATIRQVALISRQLRVLRTFQTFVMQRLFEFEQAQMLTELKSTLERLMDFLKEAQRSLSVKEFSKLTTQLQKLAEELAVKSELVSDLSEELSEEELDETAERVLERLRSEELTPERIRDILKELERES